MPRLTLHLLGPPLVELDGEPVRLGHHKVLALLAYLALTQCSHSRDSLATLFWPNLDQSRARGRLRRTLSLLNRTLGSGWLAVDREAAGWAPEAAVWLDVDVLRQRLAACRAHGHASGEACSACVPLLAEAVELYRDGFLAGFTLPDSPGFDEWQFFEAEGLRDAVAGALQRLACWHGACGEHEAAIAYARRWLALDPVHEPAHRQLMELYARSGQRAAALRQYDECQRVLQQELGSAPQEETVRLHQAIHEGRELPPAPGVPSPEGAARKHNLPAQLIPFVGREAVLAEIQACLQDPACRLMTLAGPGGGGKTRLALEAAARQIDRFTHGAFFVSLAPLQSAHAIVPTIAQALRFSFSREGDPQQQLIDYLRQRSMLLLLDNCEHLLDGIEIVSEILQEAAQVKVMATSRARLGLRGEVLLHVVGMDYPALTPDPSPGGRGECDDAIQYSAVKLFLSCAQQVQPRFDPRAADLAQVVRICHLVEGMPLAILLAAAWVPALTLAEIAAEIASQIPGQSLDFLEADWRDAPQRQRSMRAAFDHSWHLLSDREQAVFAALAVFRGGCTREAAQQVTGASLRELISLVDKSMVQRTSSGRYELHELLRQYAAEKLAQTADGGEALRGRHAAYYVAALQQWASDLKGPRQVAAIAEMDVEIDNARAAWNWAAERGQVKALGRAVDGLGLFYDWRVRYEEGEAAFRTAADRLAEAGQPLSPEAVRVWAKVLAWQGSMHYSAAGDPEPAMQLFQQSLDLLGEPGLEERSILADKAFALRQMGEVSGERGDLERAQWFGEQSLALYRESGDRSGQAVVLLDLGEKLRRLRVLDESRRLHEESLALHQELGNLRGIADADVTLAVFLLQQGALEEGERLARESLVIYRQIDHLSSALVALWFVGLSLHEQGRFAEALAPWEEYEALSDDLGRGGQGVELAWARVELGQYEQARAAAQETLHMSPRFPLYRRWIGCAFLELCRVALAVQDDAGAQQLIQQALPILQEMRYDDDVGLALSMSGIVALRLGQLSDAQRHLADALRVGIEAHMPFALACALAGIALLLAGRGQVERAVEFYALASRDPVIAHSRWYEDVVGRHIAATATALPPDIIAAAQDSGRARDLWATVEELLQELS